MRFPRVRFTVRRMMVAVGVMGVLLAGCVRAYRQVIPTGAEFFPYWLAATEGPELVSPDGQRVVRVVFNDAGGAHSGNHWTWLVVDDGLTGKHVITEGYSNSFVRNGEVRFPSRWLDDRTLSVEFVAGRYSDITRLNQVEIAVP